MLFVFVFFFRSMSRETLCFVFFFSSGRRHTISYGDWSSDVCSSDLGLVQFGPSSAQPHGGPAGPQLERETVVLIDAGCRVAGYDSDITRTIWFGDNPADEFKKVFNFVHDAQTAAM